MINFGAGDGQPDGQVEAVDDLPVPQGGLEDDEWAPDHIMDGIQSLLLLDSLTGAQLEIIDMSHQMSHQ